MASNVKRTEYVKPVDDEIIVDSTERFVIKINDFKQSMGLWYSLLAQRILPFMLFLIPVNVILGRINGFIMTRFPVGIDLNGTPLLVMWAVVMLAFLAVTIFAPKAATVMEFVIGIAYLYLAFRHHLFHNVLGYSLLIGMILFLLFKLVFLIFKLIGIKRFSKDDNNIERDESGRVVREAGGDVWFTKENDNVDSAPVTDDEVFFTSENDSDDGVPVTDDEVFFTSENDSDESVPVTDDDFFFG